MFTKLFIGINIYFGKKNYFEFTSPVEKNIFHRKARTVKIRSKYFFLDKK